MPTVVARFVASRRAVRSVVSAAVRSGVLAKYAWMPM